MIPDLAAEALVGAGVRLVSGVPCSVLDPLSNALRRRSDITYVPAVDEGEALAMAAGGWLGGALGAVLLQNSGLGNVVNPLSSLCLPYRIPAVLIVSWRGRPGDDDAPHHVPMGSATMAILKTFDIPHHVLDAADDVTQVVANLAATATATRRPAALVVPKGTFPATAAARAAQHELFLEERLMLQTAEPVMFQSAGIRATRSQIVDTTLTAFPHAAVVSTTGYMSRALAARGAESRWFPMQGSMGYACALALGVAEMRPRVPVVVLDGDGAILMRLGSLATVGNRRPPAFVHVVSDNGTYASTGGQPTASAGVRLELIAAACGYRFVAVSAGASCLQASIKWAHERVGAGPVFLRASMSTEEDTVAARPSSDPADISCSFRAHLAPGLTSKPLPPPAGDVA